MSVLICVHLLPLSSFEVFIMLQGSNCWRLPITCKVASPQFIFLVNFMNYCICTIHFLLILEQGLLGYATQTTIRSAPGLFIMHNRIASALFNFQVKIAECPGFYLLPISNALYTFSHTSFLLFCVLPAWILSQVLQPGHAGILFKQVNSREWAYMVRIALSLHSERRWHQYLDIVLDTLVI